MAIAVPYLIGAAVGSSIFFGKEQLEASADQRRAQQELEKQRRKQLADEAAVREAAAAKAATGGQRAGGSRSTFTSALGFGSGTAKPGLGAGTLFGN